MMTFKAGGLNDALFAENFGGVAVDEWARWGPTIKQMQQNDPLAYELFERFAKQVAAADAARGRS